MGDAPFWLPFRAANQGTTLLYSTLRGFSLSAARPRDVAETHLLSVVEGGTLVPFAYAKMEDRARDERFISKAQRGASGIRVRKSAT